MISRLQAEERSCRQRHLSSGAAAHACTAWCIVDSSQGARPDASTAACLCGCRASSSLRRIASCTGVALVCAGADAPLLSGVLSATAAAAPLPLLDAGDGWAEGGAGAVSAAGASAGGPPLCMHTFGCVDTLSRLDFRRQDQAVKMTYILQIVALKLCVED